MATARNTSRFKLPVTVSSGNTVEYGEVDDVDPLEAGDAALLASGEMTIVDPDAPPSAPASSTVRGVVKVPYDPLAQAFTFDLSGADPENPVPIGTDGLPLFGFAGGADPVGAWQDIALAPGWSNYDVSVQCYKDRERVFLRGSVLFSTGSGGDNLFIGTLPTGHRPPAAGQLARFVLPTDPYSTDAASLDKDWSGYVLDDGQIRLLNRPESLGPPTYSGPPDQTVFILDHLSFRVA